MGNWPLLQHLIYYETKVTSNGSIVLLESLKWPNLCQLEHSLNESFFNYVRTIVSIYYQALPLWVIVLDTTWQKSTDIYLSTFRNGCHEKMLLLAHDKWNQFEHIQLSFDASPKIGSIQSITWPSNLKTFDGSKNLLSDEKKLETLFLENYPLSEDLNLNKTGIIIKGIEILISRSDWSCLRKLDISGNSIHDRELEVLVSAIKWQLLKDLNLGDTKITVEGIGTLINESYWAILKKLDVSYNSIQNRGVKILTGKRWDMLESLSLRGSKMTAEGIETLIHQSNWPQLKKLDISDDLIENEGLELLSYGNWPLLEHLDLLRTGITAKGVKSMVNLSKWTNLKVLDLSWDKQIFDRELGALASRRWPLLESLYLNETDMTLSDFESLANESSWLNLKEISIKGHYERDGIETIISKRVNLKRGYNQRFSRGFCKNLYFLRNLLASNSNLIFF